jgi:hypothetical protein
MAKSGVCRLAQVVTPSIETRMRMKRPRRKRIIGSEEDFGRAEDGGREGERETGRGGREQ